MSTFLNNDDAIWLKNIDADPNTIALLRQITAGTRLKLEIEGTFGEWEKMANGKDGRITQGLKPVGKTREYWKTMKHRRGDLMKFKVVDPRDNYLAAAQATLSEWETEEDEKAFSDL